MKFMITDKRKFNYVVLILIAVVIALTAVRIFGEGSVLPI